MYNLEQMDNSILCGWEQRSDGSYPVLFEIYENTYKGALSYAQNNLYKFYPIKTWYKDLKKSSPVVGLLMQNETFLITRGVTIDQVIIMLCSYINYNKTNTYKLLIDRFLAQRSHTSTKTVYDVFNFLSNIGVVYLKYSNNRQLVKLNASLLRRDKYLLQKCKRFRKRDLALKKQYILSDIPPYSYPYTQRTINRKKNEIIMGMCLAYNELAGEYYKTPEQLIDNQLNGERTDITYIQAPIHLISKIMGISPFRTTMYLRSLCKSSAYIKKHNKTYIDGEFIHYKYHSYRVNCPLVNAKEAPLEKGKPIINENSYIIFNEQLHKTKLYKKVNSELEYYRTLILKELRRAKKEIQEKQLTWYDYYDFDTTNLHKQALEEIIEDNPYLLTPSDKLHLATIWGDDAVKNVEKTFSVIDKKKIHTTFKRETKRRIINTNTIVNSKPKSLVYLLLDIINNIHHCQNKDVKHYLKMCHDCISMIEYRLTELLNDSTEEFFDVGFLIYKKGLDNIIHIPWSPMLQQH